MKKRKIRNICDSCGADIFDNVMPPPIRVTCADCVQRRLLCFSRQSVQVGTMVKNARTLKNWSQRIFAEIMGCSQQFVNLVEKGEKKPSQNMRNFLLSVSGR